MPKTKRTPTVEVKLAAADHVRFDTLCRLKGKRKTQVVRDAVRWYLDNEERLVEEQRDSVMEQRLRKMENHLASIMARTMLDVNILYAFMWNMAEPGTRQKLFEACYTQAVDRMKKKLNKVETEMKELMKTPADD